MQHADFGEKVDVQALFDFLVTRSPRICATDAQLLKLHHYETAFGIYDHERAPDKDDPLALIRMHEAERTNGLLFERIKRFRDREIYRLFGLNLNEFFANTREVCDYLEELALESLKSKTKTDEEKVEELERLARGLG